VKYASARGRFVILAMVLGSGMAAIDSTVVGIALPTIGREFHASFGALQWVVTGYTLTLAGLLLLGGSLGDHYGRRRVFCIGIVWFVVASAACAFSPGVTFLVVMRVLQGIGAALLTPGSLAILQASFDAGDRGRAIGAWSGLGGVATAAGPLLGGYLVVEASWRWVFIINVPLGAVVLLLSVRHVPESRDPTATGPIDLTGALTATVALAGVTYALIEGPTRGWTDPLVLTMLALGAVAGFAFVRVERTSRSPMLPLAVFGRRQFTVTNLVTFIVYGALGGALFLLPVQLQVVDHYSPLESGVALLPVTVIMLVRTTSDSSYLTAVAPAVIVFGLGLAATVAPLTITALASVSDQHAGLASAVNNDVARVGSLIAVAVLPPLAGLTGNSYLHPAELSGAFRSAVLVSGSLCVLGGVVAALGIRNPHAASGPSSGTAKDEHVACHHCALDSAPLVADA
jgi:MFS family permease